MTKTIRRKISFTLLEIVIVTLLISLMAGVGAWSLTDLLAKHRRQAEVEELKNFLQELQIEALALRTDIDVMIIKVGEIVKVRSKTAEKILRDRTVELKGVEKLTFQGREEKNKRFQIFSTGRISPEEVVGIERKKESLWVDFRLPIQIKFSSKKPDPLKEEKIPNKPKEG